MLKKPRAPEDGQHHAAQPHHHGPADPLAAGQPGDVPTALNTEYYTQRASAGLIVTEATQVSRQGQGYALTPGIYTDAQEAVLTDVVKAVHAHYGHIALQLWHVGRISHSLLQENGSRSHRQR